MKDINVVHYFCINSTHSSLTITSGDLLFYLIYPALVKYSHYLLDHLLTLTSLSNKIATPIIPQAALLTPISLSSSFKYVPSSFLGGSSQKLVPLPLSQASIAASYYFCSTCLVGIFFLSSFLPYSFGKSLLSQHLLSGLVKFRMTDEVFFNIKNETKQNEPSAITLTTTPTKNATSSSVATQPLIYPVPTHLTLITPLLNRIQLSLCSPPNQVSNNYTELIMLSWNILRFLEEFI
jgi:hypothetical protein